MKKVAGAINLAILGVKVLTMKRKRAGSILLEVEGAEKVAILERKIRDVVGEVARIRRPERRTPVLLLEMPEWAKMEDVATGLSKTVVRTTLDGNSISIRENAGGNGDWVARVDLPKPSLWPRLGR